MILIYKYLALGGVALLLAVGIFFYGLHLGTQAGDAKLNRTVASLNAQAATALSAALLHQQQELAALHAQAQTAIAAATAARQTATANLSHYQAALAQVAHEKPVENWNTECIPAAIRRSLQLAPACR